MRSMADVESIDAIHARNPPTGRKFADYLAYDRRVIIEVKSLDSDPINKIQRFLDDRFRGRSLEIVGNTMLSDLFQDIPDGSRLFDELQDRVTKVLEDDIANADRQIRDSKLIFDLKDAIGVTVILNENAFILFPDISTKRIFLTLRKMEAGAVRYNNTHVAILISESHAIGDYEDQILFPVSTTYSDLGNATPFATVVAEEFVRLWAAFNSAGYLEAAEGWDRTVSRGSIGPIIIAKKSQE